MKMLVDLLHFCDQLCKDHVGLLGNGQAMSDPSLAWTLGYAECGYNVSNCICARSN